MKLVDDWKRCYRWFSVQSMAISGALLATWALMPEDLKSSLPPQMIVGTAVGILALGVIGRVVEQPPKS